MAPSRTSPPPPSSSVTGLTPEQLTFFKENGYLIIPDYLPAKTASSVLSHTNQMLNDFSLEGHPMTRFTTGEDDSNDKHVGDDYFLSSNDKIRYFFESDAFSSAPPHNLTKPKHLAINKIGHALHSLDPAFAAISTTGAIGARNAAIARDIGFTDPRVLQSMVICKQPEIGAEVPPHQDSAFLYTDPPSAVGWWFALEDATVENGCLSFAAGSHKRAAIEKRFIRKDVYGEDGTGFEDVSGARFPKGLETEKEKSGEEVYTMGEVKAGSLVLIHGNILHKSERNLSSKSRFIYTFHVIEGAEEWQYDKKNWLQPPGSGEGFTRLFSAEA